MTSLKRVKWVMILNISGGQENMRPYSSWSVITAISRGLKCAHKEIKTFPHHKHLGSEKVIESLAPSLGEVLQEIEGILFLP
jgi:hypothetical protein